MKKFLVLALVLTALAPLAALAQTSVYSPQSEPVLWGRNRAATGLQILPALANPTGGTVYDTSLAISLAKHPIKRAVWEGGRLSQNIGDTLIVATFIFTAMPSGYDTLSALVDVSQDGFTWSQLDSLRHTISTQNTAMAAAATTDSTLVLTPTSGTAPDGTVTRQLSFSISGAITGITGITRHAYAAANFIRLRVRHDYSTFSANSYGTAYTVPVVVMMPQARN